MYIALHFECQFNKNTLLQSCFLAFLVVGLVLEFLSILKMRQFRSCFSLFFLSLQFCLFCRAKELGPDNSGDKGKKVIDLDYNEEDSENEGNEGDDEVRPLSNSNSHYRNAELAMLCTKSVRISLSLL